ncbi:vacuolar fusion protein MON1 A [Echinococcus multilocularis]|uniref:Vacuolar fusion protein MON1 homolog n=1 Tax=Echinococcus multilocularis TaxID=6211 RepID=A0A087VZ26_ECHMU|nr:vacuolar fusion protein MON1 A [Echinococcus multilocularis]
MSQFDNVGLGLADLDDSFTADSSVENEVIDSPFTKNGNGNNSPKQQSLTDSYYSLGTAPRNPGPLTTSSDLESSFYDSSTGKQCESSSGSMSFSAPSSPIKASAKDLGLDPDLLHVFVFSDAGKPIYTRHGDESQLAHVMGVMHALISVVAQQGDQLQTLVAGDKHIVFRTFGHLILVAIGPSCEPVSHLSVILKYVYNQIVSALTHQRIDKWFMQKQNLDLRNLMIGDCRLLTGAVELVETQMGPTLNAVLCIPLPKSIRDTVVQAIIHGAKSQDLLFAILLTNYRVVCIVSIKKRFLHPIDIHLITNLVRCSQSFRNASTNWLPICLPKFNCNGYLYANLSYLDNHSCLVLLTVDSNQFYALQTSRDQILSRLQSSLQGECLQRLASATWPDVASLGFGGGLRHFVCKLVPAAQYTTSRWTPPYNFNTAVPTSSSPSDSSEVMTTASAVAAVKQRQAALLRAYRVMHKNLHCHLHPVSSIFQASNTEAHLASLSPDYEVYMTLEPLVSKQEAFDILNRLTKWISANKQRLFILASPTF